MEIAPLPADPEIVPFCSPDADTDDSSPCTIVSDGGPPITLWSLPGTHVSPQTDCEVQLQLSPDSPVIIGRQEGGEIEYLDPRYHPSPIVPGSGETILQRDGADRDIYVSRGHFMLRGHSSGILFTNGVPRRGGGIRPPKNRTQLLAPQYRTLAPAEEMVIERDDQMTIWLPNGTKLTIRAM
jgi:hypothetical protein